MRHPRRFTSLLLIATVWILTACAGGKASPTYYYTLDYPSPVLNFSQRLPYVLRVDRFAASPPFDSRRMIYGEKGLYRNAYAHFQWIAAPGDMLAFLLGRDLRQTGAFEAVLPPDAATPPTYLVKGWVETFLEDDDSPNGKAVLKLSITLINNQVMDISRRVVFQKSYAAEALCEAKDPAALAVAMSRAVGQVSPRMLQAIYDALLKQPLPGNLDKPVDPNR